MCPRVTCVCEQACGSTYVNTCTCVCAHTSTRTGNVYFSAADSAYRCDILDHGRLINVGRVSSWRTDVKVLDE